MIVKMYTIFDHQAEFFGIPFFCRNHGEALRVLSELVNDPTTTISRHPKDFSMFAIAEYDDQTAKLEPYKAREKLASPLSLITNPQEDFFGDKDNA